MDRFVTDSLVPDSTDPYILESVRMFRNCTALVGGVGTTFNSNKTNKEYTHIDGGTSNPGYFTDIKNKPNN